MIAAWLLAISWDELRVRLETLLEAGQRGFVDLVLALLGLLLGWGLAALAAWLVRVVLRAGRFDTGVRGLLGTTGGLEPSVFGSWRAQGTLLAVTVLLALDVLGFEDNERQ